MGLVGLYDFYSISGPVNFSTHKMKYKACTTLITLLKYRLPHIFFFFFIYGKTTTVIKKMKLEIHHGEGVALGSKGSLPSKSK